MKFVKYLESITGVSVYPLFSLILFSLFFLVVAAYAISADKRKMDANSQIPLEQ